MWNAMKGRKRCVIPVMGYYEWLKKSPKERIPYFTKRADGKIMLLAGLWDSVQYEGNSERRISELIQVLMNEYIHIPLSPQTPPKACLFFMTECL
jgi:putative SOS response-associated peptidase YedK